jgi:hypothetical protein
MISLREITTLTTEGYRIYYWDIPFIAWQIDTIDTIGFMGKIL